MAGIKSISFTLAPSVPTNITYDLQGQAADSGRMRWSYFINWMVSKTSNFMNKDPWQNHSFSLIFENSLPKKNMIMLSVCVW